MVSRRFVALPGLAACAAVVGVTVAAWAQTPGGAPVPGGVAAPAVQSEIGPLEQSAVPITPENPIPRRIHSVAPLYPAEAAGSGLGGVVGVRVTLDTTGRVGEARIASGFSGGSAAGDAAPRLADAFNRSALAAVQQWVYDPPAEGPVSFNVQFRFTPEADAELVFHAQPLTPATSTRLTSGTIAKRYPNAVRVGGAVGAPKKIKDVKPVYPPIAQSAKVSGIVILETVIGDDGRVLDAAVVRSIPLLDQAALDAVRQWEFTPTLLNGAPTPVVMTVTVNFQLAN